MKQPDVFQRTDDFDPERFRDPPAIDRGAPFWSWNGDLEAERLCRQLHTFRAMGLGGAHLHPRTGLSTPYLSEAFFELVDACASESDRLGLLTWLYDEDRWPSGFAGGLAVTDRAHWCRHLRITRWRPVPGEDVPAPVHHGPPQPNTERTFVAAWALCFDNSLLRSRRRMAEDDAVGEGEAALYAYVEIAPAFSWFNNRQYVDTLSPAAMRRFIDVTHEAYFARFGERFGHSMPAIFTDEPLFRGMQFPSGCDDEQDRFIAWTDDLPATYGARFNEDILDVLPDVLFDREDGRHALARWRFHDHHTDRFVEAFAAQIGAWCEAHGIALTGHMMNEPLLGGQTGWVGEAMRSLWHFQLPGIDMLCDGREYTTAKQAQSVARQRGAPGVLSELYGVTNWDFPFEGHKRQGDWQAALGVTTRVHHLTWYQMSGESKRDYPASMGDHVPWAREYPVIENHFARVTAALRSGRPVCRVAMIHPIESMWLHYGPRSSEDMRRELEEGFSATLRWLLEGLVDADLVSEACLAMTTEDSTTHGFRVGEMVYDVVVIPPLVTLRSSTLARLRTFREAGGTVICLGRPPAMVDAVPVAKDDERMAGWEFCTPEREGLLEAVSPWREVRLTTANGGVCGGALHHLRQLPDGGRILFVCRVADGENLEGAEVAMRGVWRIEQLDTETGECVALGAAEENGWTRWSVDLPVAGHMLVRCRPGHPSPAALVQRAEASRTPLPPPMSVTRDEPNVVVLDRATWRLNDGAWQPAEEVLRLDNLVRAELGQPPRHGNIAQPWVEPPASDDHRVTLRYKLAVDVPTGPLRLALEDADRAQVCLDGVVVAEQPDGEWVDVAFQTLTLPALDGGTHALEITWPFGGGAGIEAAYLLGDFGVRVDGTQPRLGALSSAIDWGDVTRQGLAFYGGNLTYRVCVEVPPDGNVRLEISDFAGALCGVRSATRDLGRIYRPPYRLTFPPDLRGNVELDITCFGTRINTFGQLHNAVENYRWWGPQSWRTTGDQWTDGYRLRPTGILRAPELTVERET